MKKIVLIITLVLPTLLFCRDAKYSDWRLQDFKKDGSIAYIKKKCIFGWLYYISPGTLCIPVLDHRERMVKCKGGY